MQDWNWNLAARVIATMLKGSSKLYGLISIPTVNQSLEESCTNRHESLSCMILQNFPFHSILSWRYQPIDLVSTLYSPTKWFQYRKVGLVFNSIHAFEELLLNFNIALQGFKLNKAIEFNYELIAIFPCSYFPLLSIYTRKIAIKLKGLSPLKALAFGCDKLCRARSNQF